MSRHAPRSLLILPALAAGMTFAPVDVASAPGMHDARGPEVEGHVNAAARDVSWTAGLARSKDEVNIITREGAIRIGDANKRFASIGRQRAFGSVTLQPHTLPTAVNRIRATVRASIPSGGHVAVDVRGRTNKGWTEWNRTGHQSPAVLPHRVTQVQVRVILRASEGVRSPAVRRVRLTADSVPTAMRTPDAEPRTYSIFATREGLAGETTANGHVIEPRDHFVALPSTRALSPEGAGDYSVKVCSPDTGRCAFAPVWDVGPWNVHDDYWNPAPVRKNWSDLPQGTPQAEAAYKDGYNDGKDGFGREVLNPAGIDLADGTFWDGVGLDDNDWVNVTYLWTASYPAAGEVGTASSPLRVRSAPTTNSSIVGLAGQHAQVPIFCQTHGETVHGFYGTTDLWNKVGQGMYISGAYTDTRSGDGLVAPLC